MISGIQSESKMVQGHPANREVGIEVGSVLEFDRLKSVLADFIGDD